MGRGGDSCPLCLAHSEGENPPAVSTKSPPPRVPCATSCPAVPQSQSLQSFIWGGDKHFFFVLSVEDTLWPSPFNQKPSPLFFSDFHSAPAQKKKKTPALIPSHPSKPWSPDVCSVDIGREADLRSLGPSPQVLGRRFLYIAVPFLSILFALF